MAECILSESLIRQRSEDLQIPFVDLLPSAVTEYFLYQISKSTFAEKLYLRNGSSLGVENYRRKRVFSLSYYYQVVKDEHLTEMQLGQLMKGVSEDNCPMSFRTDAKPSAVQNTLVQAQPRREGGKQG